MKREERIAALKAALDERILLLDGAMGTMIQAYRLGEDDYRGQRFADWSTLLLEQAVLAEGGQLEDPAGFVHRMNALLADEPAAATDEAGGNTAESRENEESA